MAKACLGDGYDVSTCVPSAGAKPQTPVFQRNGTEMQEQKFTTCLMFVGKQQGKCQEAIEFYLSLFKNSKIIDLERFDSDASGGVPGTVKKARFSLGSQQFLALDGGTAHEFSFTPAISIFVECESEDELDGTFSKLSEGGSIKMPPNNYGFSKKFAWVDDRFGVSWQLNLRDQPSKN